MKTFHRPFTSPMLRRREFLGTALTALASTLPAASFARVKELIPGTGRMGIVVHSYATRWNPKVESARYPGFTNALDLLRHCHAIGAGGLQVGVNQWTPEFADTMRNEKEKLGLYLEGSIAMPLGAGDVPAFERNVSAAKRAGIDIVRTVCTAGRRYEIYHSAADFDRAREQAVQSLQLAEPVVRKHKVKLGIENHKDWRAPELVDLLKVVSSEWLGATLDFGNSIALMEDPMEVARTLAPYAVSTHVKDMGLEEYDQGVLLSEVPLGKGILDLAEMVNLCRHHNPSITFNLEMITRDPLVIPCLTDDYWSTMGHVPGRELARTLRTMKARRSPDPLPRVSQLTVEQRLAVEEQNILSSMQYSEKAMALK